jgi:hypothetical protein
MELETFVLENSQEVDFGQLQDVIEEYRGQKSHFQEIFAVYKKYIADLKFKSPALITTEEESESDKLLGEVSVTDSKLKKLQHDIISATQTIMEECGEMEKNLKRFTDFLNPEDISYGRTLFKEAVNFLNAEYDLIEGIAMAKEVKENLENLLSQAKCAWMVWHQDKIAKLESNQ